MRPSRQPVILTLDVIGIDPGIASTGVCVLRIVDRKPTIAALGVAKTTNTNAKARKAQKMTAAFDDQRRMADLWDYLAGYLKSYVIRLAAIEGYAPHPGTTGNNGWKTALAYQTACNACNAFRVPFVVQRPADLRRALLGKGGGGKAEIIGSMATRIHNFAENLNQYSPGVWEHVADAAAHAYLVSIKKGFIDDAQA